MESKRISGLEPWLPRQKRTDRLGLALPPGKDELRTPLFRLASEPSGIGSELYFVNDSEETLISVGTEYGGSITVDDEAVTLKTDEGHIYCKVKPGEAVKVEEFDGYYDLDYLFQARLYVESAKLGKLQLVTYPSKGQIPDQELLWDTLEPAKHVNVTWDNNEED